MAASRKISEVTFGGTAANNPPNYSWTDYSNYPDLDTAKTYVRMNVMYFDGKVGVNLQVTGLVVSANGQLLMGPNDLVYIPCPPSC